jgi:hypothetical protein
MQLTEAQLKQQLDDRLRLLKRSASAYDDQHDFAEATRMASSIVKLIGDRKKKSGADNQQFTSLTTRLGMKPAVMRSFTLTQVLDQPSLHGAVCTAGIGLVGCEGWVPVLDGIPPAGDSPYQGEPMQFEDWWHAPVLLSGRVNV